jgi:hypothetical protein
MWFGDIQSDERQTIFVAVQKVDFFINILII